MMRYDITRFVGSWIDASGYRLKIEKLTESQATVDFLDPSGDPVRRPYMTGAPSLGMVAHYDDYNGTFEVDLWEVERGFMLDLSHEYDYELDEKRREALVPGITRYERDHFLDEFSPLFGRLEHFVRAETQNPQVQRTEASHKAVAASRESSSAGSRR